MPNPQKRSSKRKQQRLVARRNQVVAVPIKSNRRKTRRNKPSTASISSHFPRLHSHSLDYIKSLRNPWAYRQVRLPTLYPIATQAHTCHGNLTFTANGLGFCRLAVNPFDCNYVVYNDAVHTETNIGNGQILTFPGAPSFADGASRFRLVSAGLLIRSTSSFSNEAGLMQTYVTYIGATVGNYDVYRDSPFVFPYSKGQTAEVVYLPFMPRCFDFLSSSERASSFQHYNLGVMISGAPNVVYSVQYAINYEMIQSVNTDLVPLKTAPVANTHDLMGLVAHNSPVNKEWTIKSYITDKVYEFSDGVSKLGYALLGANTSSGNGFFRDTVKPRAGNEAILYAV